MTIAKLAYIIHLGGLLINDTLGKLGFISEERWEHGNFKQIMRMKRVFESYTGLDFFEEYRKH